MITYEETPELKINEFFLLINSQGYYLKTKFKEDFDNVSTCKGLLFSDKVSNSDFLHYKVGSIWQKKKIANLSNAKNSQDTLWFDICELEMKNGNNISKVKLGGSQIPQTYENL